MADLTKQVLAQCVFKTACSALDNIGWKYETETDKLVIRYGVSGDDIPMNFILVVDAERQLIRLLSFLPFKMPEDKRVDGAVATSVINYKLADGTFEYDLSDGTICFKVTATYRDSEVSEELVSYVVGVSCAMVDGFNDKFFAISKGFLTLSDFVKENT